MKILIIGDIVGSPGRRIIQAKLKSLKKSRNIDFVIANGENAAGGSGVTKATVKDMFSYGIDVITTGDHIWKRKESHELVGTEKALLRPANYPSQAPGAGWNIYRAHNGLMIGVVNLLGRVFMQPIECPFKKVKEAVEDLKKKADIIFVDFHAEATSEKIALGWYLDGLVSCVFGTHTHVQTADEKILPKGTAYITDLGMTGPMDSVIGRKKEQILERFITQMPVRFEMAEKDVQLQGAIVEVDDKTGLSIGIERLVVKE
ncbi:MAG: TIGR00282 family metallophosphoesterase [Candidatus Omnitrophota bacterium]